MHVVTNDSTNNLWRETIKEAEERCSITLSEELENYLTSLLFKYTNKPEIAQQVFAEAYLKAMQLHRDQKLASLQQVGDQCLLFAGLFPKSAEKKSVKLTYFVELGQAAYVTVSRTANDLYWLLSTEFVMLMDVLQSIKPYSDLLPLEAYDQWNDLGSRRAFLILKEYSKGMPFKK